MGSRPLTGAWVGTICHQPKVGQLHVAPSHGRVGWNELTPERFAEINSRALTRARGSEQRFGHRVGVSPIRRALSRAR